MQKMGIVRLSERNCLSSEDFGNSKYRETIGQDSSYKNFLKIHDSSQDVFLRSIDLTILDDAILADIGCAGGGFLNKVKDIVQHAYAIESAIMYHESLAERGYFTFLYMNDVPSNTHNGINLPSINEENKFSTIITIKISTCQIWMAT